MPLVQEARRGFPLKIVAAVLGGLLCVDLIARMPIGESGGSSDTATPERVAASGSRSETTAPSAPVSSPPLVGAPSAPAPEPAPSAIREAQVTPPAAATRMSEQQAKIDPVETNNNPAEGNCEQQTWPYLDGRCKEAASAAAPGTRQVRVVGKDSSAPTVVVTPLPAETVVPRETAKSQDNPSVQTSPAPPADNRMNLATAPTDAKPDQGAASNVEIAMPRPAPESLRRPVEAVAPPPAIRDLEGTPERPVRREARERGKDAKAQKSERPRFTRSQPAAEQETRGATPRHAGITESRAYQLPSGRRIVVFRQANGEVGIAPAERRASGGGSYFFDW